MPTQSTQLKRSGHLIEPERVAEGFLLVDPAGTWSWFNNLSLAFGCLWLSIWCGISFPAFAAVIIFFIASPSLESFLMLAFISLFALIGAIGITQGARWLAVFTKLEPGEAILSAYPLRMGESCRVRYRRRLRRGATSRPGQITAKWLCYEWIEYGRGTNSVTKTHILSEIDLPKSSIPRGSKAIEYEARVKIPAQGPPSFDANNNQVRWEILIDIDLPGVIKDASCFRFKVIPEVM